MREIKFRAWDGEQMIDTFSVQSNGDGINYRGNIMTSWKLMQYTGLTDKNGKEIYESDIVLANGMESVLDNDMSQARKYISPMISDSRHFEKRRSAYQVYWQHNFCCFSFMSLSTPKHSIEVDVNSRELEIIGNIFEHSHLLRKQ